MKKLTLFLILCVYSINMFSQNITNTIGTSGSFIIKDGANTFLTLDQLNGYLTLNSGVIFFGADRFLHKMCIRDSISAVSLPSTAAIVIFISIFLNIAALYVDTKGKKHEN